MNDDDKSVLERAKDYVKTKEVIKIKKERNFRKFQLISYEFEAEGNLFQFTKNFGTEELILADKKSRTFIKLSFKAMNVFAEYLNLLIKESEVI